MQKRIDRRDFLKIAGAAAGFAAARAILPSGVFAAVSGEAALGAVSINRPVFMAPEIVARGAAIPFKKTAAADAAISSIWMRPSKGGDKISLSISPDSTLIPQSAAPAGMYDIFAEYTKGGETKTEQQPNAVKIVDSFKKDFVFGVISDTHFGDTRIKAKNPALDPAETLKKEIGILNSRGVEFCLCCGDLCFIPPKSKKEMLDFAKTVYSEADFPLFTVPGNHDGYSTAAGGRVQFDPYAFWDKSFGPLNFSASYGGITLIGINSFDVPPLQRNMYGGFGEALDMGAVQPEQLAWIEQELKTARAKNPSGSIILFCHHNPTNNVVDVNGPFSIAPFTETGRKELLGLLDKYTPEYLFCGHVHGAHEETYGKTKILTVPTATSLPAEGQPIGFYIVTVKNNVIASWETIEIARV